MLGLPIFQDSNFVTIFKDVSQEVTKLKCNFKVNYLM